MFKSTRAIVVGMFALCAIVGTATLLVGQPHAGDDELVKLAKARKDAAEKAYLSWSKFERNHSFTDMMYQLSVRWLHADLELASKNDDRMTAYTAHLDRMKDWEIGWRAAIGGGRENHYVVVIRSFQREAEFWLAKEKSAKK